MSGGGYTVTKSEVDFKGHELCDSCWNGYHKCVMPCECPCRDVKSEKHRKPKPDFSQQCVIDTGDDVIVIRDSRVDSEHRDEG